MRVMKPIRRVRASAPAGDGALVAVRYASLTHPTQYITFITLITLITLITSTA
jgi:hypothetical protein